VTIEVYNKFNERYLAERNNIMKQLDKCAVRISNLSQCLERALVFANKLSMVWSSSDIKGKEDLQKVLFPAGIVYDREIRAFRTPEINTILR
jgi:site-specific DNA recombinase